MFGFLTKTIFLVVMTIDTCGAFLIQSDSCYAADFPCTKTPFKKFTKPLCTISMAGKKSLCTQNLFSPDHLSLPDVFTSDQIVMRIFTSLASVLVLNFVILVHETGHFTAARSLGIYVQEFSVGIGPRLLKIVNSNTGIEFSLRAIPFGGYVKFPENYDVAQLIEDERDLRIERARVQRQQKEIKKNLRDSQEAMRTLNFGSTRSMENNSMRLNPESSSQNNGRAGVEYYTDPNLLQNRPWIQRAIVLASGVLFNFILAFICYFGQLIVPNAGMSTPIYESGTVVTTKPAFDSAGYGLLQPGDLIIGVNGKKLMSPRLGSQSQVQKSVRDFVEQIRATPWGDTLTLEVMQQQSSSSRIVNITPRPISGDYKSFQTIGVSLTPNYIRTETVHAKSFKQAAQLSLDRVVDITYDTSSSVMNLGKFITNGDQTVGQRVSGPIGAIKVGSDVFASNDASAIFAFAAAISINLAVINSLPLPALDGGQMAFVLGEAVYGEKIDQRTQEEINAVAFLILFLASIGSSIGDVEGFLIQ